MSPDLSIIRRSFNLKVGNIQLAPEYWQAVVIVLLLFALLLTLARMRYLYLHWSFGKSSMAMMFWGFLLALVFEGFLLIGGKTLLTEVLGWKNAPKPISTALDAGRTKLVNVLGQEAEVPLTNKNQSSSSSSVFSDYQSLSPAEAEKVKLLICQP